MKQITFLLLIFVVFFSACTSTKLIRKVVVKEHKFAVTLEQYQDKGIAVQQKYEHPYTLDLADFGKLLEDLTYVEAFGLMNEKKISPVFQQVEIDRLAPVLVTTLAKADASQRIRFTSFNSDEGTIFSISRKTEGVMFIEPDGQLNIAFNFINSGRLSNETSVLQYSYSNVDPLKIKTSDTPLSLTVPYTVFHKFETGKMAPMWVEADIDKLKETIKAKARATVKKIEGIPPAVTSRPRTIDTSVEKLATPQVSGDGLKDIKNKLTYLKELLSEGLISQQDYNAKKMELLDRIN